MASKIEIINLALTNLGAELIISLDEETDLVSRIKNIYEVTKQAVLESHPWGFASDRITLSPLSEAPAFEYKYQFQLPSDFLRVISLYPENQIIKHTIEGKKLLADDEVIYLKFVKNITSESLFSNIFCHCFAARLSFELCQLIIGSTSKSQELWQLYQVKKKEASSTDALQKTPQPVVGGDTWVNERL